MCDFSNENRHNYAGHSCRCIRDGHQCARIVWRQVDVVREKSTEHSANRCNCCADRNLIFF